MNPIEMKNDDIRKNLQDNYRKSGGKSNIRLPARLKMKVYKRRLIIDVPVDVTMKNMQTDYSAVDAWALILKRWIKEIDEVIIKWEEPKQDIPSKTNSEKQHYQRFLYRIKRFKESYSWVSIDKENLFDVLKVNDNNNLKINKPSKARKEKAIVAKKRFEAYTENELEVKIISDEKICSSFKKKFNLELVDCQLPVGVFEEKISNETRIFTGGKSAIDIWGINKKGEFSLFELKKFGNNKVGAISEMLFYSYVIRDVQTGLIEYEGKIDNQLNKIRNSSKINCCLLAPGVHPLIDSEVFELLNTGVFNIAFGKVMIEEDLVF